tara:strand:+ start:1511 stop:1759 length:249 start_codon:yes stop_codon:yes gene_type:complete
VEEGEIEGERKRERGRERYGEREGEREGETEIVTEREQEMKNIREILKANERFREMKAGRGLEVILVMWVEREVMSLFFEGS